MRTLFVLDYSGTLTIFRDPAGFLSDLKQKYPDAKVVLYTGMEKDAIQAQSPALMALVDDVWNKPQMLAERVAGMALDRLVIADDDPLVLSASRRTFRGSRIPLVEFLTPNELRSLVP